MHLHCCHATKKYIAMERRSIAQSMERRLPASKCGVAGSDFPVRPYATSEEGEPQADSNKKAGLHRWDPAE